MLKRIAALPPVSFALEVADAYCRVGVARSAAALSYFLILSLFPLLLCVNYVIGLFHLDLEQMLSSMDQLLPTEALSVIRDYLSYVSQVQSPALMWAAVFTIILSISAGLRVLFRTMDDLYGVGRRSGLYSYLPSFVLSFLLMPTMYLSVIIILTGDWFFLLLENNLPPMLRGLISLEALSQLRVILRYLLLFCYMLLVLVVYRLGTPKALRGSQSVILPALWTSVALIACSALFSWFIDMSTRYTLVYGSLASLIILLVWLYFCGNILLLGAVAANVQSRRRQKA